MDREEQAKRHKTQATAANGRSHPARALQIVDLVDNDDNDDVSVTRAKDTTASAALLARRKARREAAKEGEGAAKPSSVDLTSEKAVVVVCNACACAHIHAPPMDARVLYSCLLTHTPPAHRKKSIGLRAL